MMDLFNFIVLSSIVILLPLITDFLNNTFPNAKIGRLATELIGMILIFFIVCLIFSGVSLWYTHFLPFYYTKSMLSSYNLLDIMVDEESSISLYGHIIFTSIIVFNLYYYYYQTIVADNYQEKLSPSKQLKLLPNEQDRKDKLCGLCNQFSNGKWSSIILKEERIHHCRICKRCTKSMDHHCPFAANCIGINNHHYFILFIIYTVVSLGYASYLSYYPYYYCILNNFQNTDISIYKSCLQFDKYSFIFYCCILIFTAAFGILLFQGYLIITNCRTIQLLSKLKKSNTFMDWLKWLYQNFKENASLSNIKSLFSNFKFYNIIIPYYK